MAPAVSQMRIKSAGTITRSGRGTPAGRGARWVGDMGTSCRLREGPTLVSHMLLADEDNISAGYLLGQVCAMATYETGHPGAELAERPLGEGWVYSVVANAPHGALVDRTGVGEGELAQIDELMAALAGLRAAEQELTRASLTYMQLNETDMKALHYLIVCEQQGVV